MAAVRMTGVAWQRARRLAYAAAEPLAPVPLALADAAGSVLAEPLVALADLPPFDAAALDGYAVRGAGPWTVVARVRAGDPVPDRLEPGSACEVATGAAVPPGADAVLPYELAETDPDGDLVRGSVRAGKHVRRTGEESVAGEKLLAAGTSVSPQVVGLAAALGHDELVVHPLPHVAALITGDELTDSGPPGDGLVRDAIGPLLPGAVGWAGGVFTGAIAVADSAGELDETLRRRCDAEVVLVSGSSSAGPADHLAGVLRGLGAILLVDRVACRPGHPQTLAALPDGRLVVGLPGNPLAALVAFLTLALPVITRLRGAALPELATAHAPTVPRHPADTRLVPVRVRDGVEPVGHAGSAMLRGAASADAIAIAPPATGTAQPVLLHPLPGGAQPWAG
jgi:molybdopterin molybdotransferase